MFALRNFTENIFRMIATKIKPLLPRARALKRRYKEV
jgi:hypothetical protein